jgi:hypothetical protein
MQAILPVSNHEIIFQTIVKNSLCFPAIGNNSHHSGFGGDRRGAGRGGLWRRRQRNASISAKPPAASNCQPCRPWGSATFHPSIPPIPGIPPAEQPLASYGAMEEQSIGKDTITGHWEICGLEINPGFHNFPMEPPSFPPELVAAFKRRPDVQ